MIGVNCQRPGNDATRFAFEAAALGHAQRIRVICEQLRITGHQLGSTTECIGGFLETLQRRIGTAEHAPSGGIIGFSFQPLCQFAHHLFDLLRRY